MYLKMNEQKATFVVAFTLAVFFQSFMVDSQGQCRNREGHQTWDNSIINLTVKSQSLPDPNIFGHNTFDDCPSYNQLIGYNVLTAQNLSLCPWTTEIHHDPNRFPHNMTYARCSCKRCVTWDASSGNRHHCMAHYQTFKVIRRTCDQGNYDYFYTYENLPIACVCSHVPIRSLG